MGGGSGGRGTLPFSTNVEYVFSSRVLQKLAYALLLSHQREQYALAARHITRNDLLSQAASVDVDPAKCSQVEAGLSSDDSARHGAALQLLQDINEEIKAKSVDEWEDSAPVTPLSMALTPSVTPSVRPSPGLERQPSRLESLPE